MNSDVQSSNDHLPDTIVRKSADEIPRATAEDLARLRAGADGPIDCSDIPENDGTRRRVHRDTTGRLPARLPRRTLADFLATLPPDRAAEVAASIEASRSYWLSDEGIAERDRIEREVMAEWPPKRRGDAGPAT